MFPNDYVSQQYLKDELKYRLPKCSARAHINCCLQAALYFSISGQNNLKLAIVDIFSHLLMLLLLYHLLHSGERVVGKNFIGIFHIRVLFNYVFCLILIDILLKYVIKAQMMGSENLKGGDFPNTDKARFLWLWRTQSLLRFF